MKKYYEAPEAEIEVIKFRSDVLTASTGNEDYDNPYIDDDF